jgi:hypothetical protein
MKLFVHSIGTVLLLVGMGSLLLAQTENCIPGVPCGAPEIDAAAASSAVALLGGAFLIIRNKKRK